MRRRRWRVGQMRRAREYTRAEANECAAWADTNVGVDNAAGDARDGRASQDPDGPNAPRGEGSDAPAALDHVTCAFPPRYCGAAGTAHTSAAKPTVNVLIDM